MFVNVVILEKNKFTDVLYPYKYDMDLSIGDRVIVPFGKKELVAYVFSFTDTIEIDISLVKNVIKKDDSLHLNEEIIKTIIWMKRRYGIKYADGIFLFIPKGKEAKKGKEKEPYKEISSSYVKPDKLTDEQINAINKINNSIVNNINDTFLIYGVTASGKTEVYMEAIEKALSLGKTAIFLVPEISLTAQMIERFSGRFGKENIAILHSKLTQRERFDEWNRLKSGNAKIAIGARMAVFSPLDNIGVIVMDEEHEATYKADMSPKYDTVDVATKRLKYSNGVLILGSATPSIVSYERAKEGIYKLVELNERYNKTPLPKIEIVDMKEELKGGNTSILSRALFNEMSECLLNKKQVILLQNRRGYSNYVTCTACGKTIKCKDCQISLTYHKKENKLICHYCGKSIQKPTLCPSCGSGPLRYEGTGTEKIEEILNRDFTDYRVARLDLDTVKNRNELDNILNSFKNKETDILIGTQLVAKGLDFDNVGLVGVIDSDTSLNIPDYRSNERTFQLITQVSGRAGRGNEQGKVIVQTVEPNNIALLSAKEHDYEKFYNSEVGIREFLEYPPFGDIIVCNFTSNKEEITKEVANRCFSYLEKILNKTEMEHVFQPKVSFLFKGNESSYRKYILIKCPKGERNRFVYYLDEFSKIIFEDNVSCNINIDVNPYQSV